jgi:hypothetical protein
MASPVVFYAWQNDRPRDTTRDFIQKAAYATVARAGSTMRVEDSPRLDHDTENESGTPPIAETILRKIKHSAIMLADMTFCSEIREGGPESKVKKKYPNPNVMLELGYGAAIMGWSRVILVMNTKYGSPQWLPFDLKNHRFPITYELGPNSTKGAEVMAGLVDGLEMAVRSCLVAEYELVNATLSRLSTHSRLLMKKHGPSDTFWEDKTENRILTLMDMSIAQMLELSVLACVEAANERGVGYTWTYLGKQCCYRLGIHDRPAVVALAGVAPQQVIVDTSYLDALEAQRRATEAPASGIRSRGTPQSLDEGRVQRQQQDDGR